MQKRAFSTVASRDAYRFDDDRRRVPRRDDIARLGVRDMGHHGAGRLGVVKTGRMRQKLTRARVVEW